MTYTSGLRPHESRTIKRSDVDLNSGEIRIVNSKWNRSRSIVLSDDMNQLARKYATLRDMKYPDSEYFFPAHAGGCYTASQLQNRFRKFYEASRPDIPRELLPAIRVYDLRHRFATAVITRWLEISNAMSETKTKEMIMVSYREKSIFGMSSSNKQQINEFCEKNDAIILMYHDLEGVYYVDADVVFSGNGMKIMYDVEAYTNGEREFSHFEDTVPFVLTKKMMFDGELISGYEAFELYK